MLKFIILGACMVLVVGFLIVLFREWKNKQKAKQIFFAIYNNFDALVDKQKTKQQLDSVEVMCEQLISLNNKYDFIKPTK